MFTFVITIFGHEFAIYLMFKFSHKLPKLNGGHTCNNDNLKLQRGGHGKKWMLRSYMEYNVSNKKFRGWDIKYCQLYVTCMSNHGWSHMKGIMQWNWCMQWHVPHPYGNWVEIHHPEVGTQPMATGQASIHCVSIS